MRSQSDVFANSISCSVDKPTRKILTRSSENWYGVQPCGANLHGPGAPMDSGKASRVADPGYNTSLTAIPLAWSSIIRAAS
jgi:hypothetical protein